MACGELARMRTAFVWRVSTEILTQLLEALVSDGVLNNLEKESILEGNPVRADKARCFIDTVRNKGDKASRIMIGHLFHSSSILLSFGRAQLSLPVSLL
uniref:CARD domain-containing protein n=1 Tax=Amphilophus citrinellus TaxID=61819 RepID=A0A3Q0QXT5_AMPCI